MVSPVCLDLICGWFFTDSTMGCITIKPSFGRICFTFSRHRTSKSKFREDSHFDEYVSTGLEPLKQLQKLPTDCLGSPHFCRTKMRIRKKKTTMMRMMTTMMTMMCRWRARSTIHQPEGRPEGWEFWMIDRENEALKTTWWWFQTFLIFTPTWGRFPFWPIFFQMGWNHQPD